MRRWLAGGAIVVAAIEGSAGASLAARPDGEPVDDERDRAIALLAKGKRDEAREVLRQRLTAQTLDTETLLALARALLKAGAVDDAERALQRALQQKPHHVGAIVLYADLYRDHEARFTKQDQLTALHLAAIDQHRATPRARFALGLSLAELEIAWGRLNEAEARLQQLAAQAPPREIAAAIAAAEQKVELATATQQLRAWPDYAPPPLARAWLGVAEEQLRHGAFADALATVDRLLIAAPTWQAALWVRGRALESMQRWADAARTFERLLRLQPADARAQRRLGLLLQEHGGPLALTAADDALRRAIALEPAYADLWLRRSELLAARGNAPKARRALDRYLALYPEAKSDAAVARVERAITSLGGKLADEPRPPPPPEEALAKMAEIENWLELGDPGGIGRRLLEDLVKRFPDFVPGLALRYRLTGEAPTDGEKALWHNAEGLFDLAERVRGAAPANDPEARKLAARWLDRAIELGHEEAIYRRALIHHDAGQSKPARALLERYLARAERPAHTTEAQALRARLAGDDRATAGEQALRAARLDLIADRDDETRATRCEGAPPDRRLALGLVAEHRGASRDAVECYRVLLDDVAGDASLRERALARVALIVAENPVLATPAIGTALERSPTPEALLARASLRIAAADDAAARGLLDRFYVDAPADGPGQRTAAHLSAGIAERAALATRRAAEHARAQRDQREIALFGGGILLFAGGLWLATKRRRTLSAALALRPALFPAVVQAIGTLRHDLLKHRTSALSLVDEAADREALRADLVAAIVAPPPATQMVKQVYQALDELATGLGAPLVRPERDPRFGPLLRDLARCEQILLGRGDLAPLVAIDRRLRGEHDRGLVALLGEGPRTPLPPATLARWLAAVRAEGEASRFPEPVITAPPALALPIEEGALFAIFSNLVRNGAQASAKSAHPALAIRLSQERDPTGRRELVLAVLDSSADVLTPTVWEQSPADRGLGIVRELVQKWRARMIVVPESAPYTKSVQVRFTA